MPRILSWLAAMMFLAACGEDRGGRSTRGDGDADTTPAALAYVAAEYFGEPDSADEGSNWTEAFRRKPLQAELRFGSTGEYDGDAVQVIVGRGFKERVTGCEQLRYQVDGCEDVEAGLWYWGEEEPEEDPGGIFVIQRKGPVTVVVAYYGPAIKGDPRNQDLPIDVQVLIDVAGDRRVGLTTTRDAVEHGAKASYWEGGSR